MDLVMEMINHSNSGKRLWVNAQMGLAPRSEYAVLYLLL